MKFITHGKELTSTRAHATCTTTRTHTHATMGLVKVSPKYAHARGYTGRLRVGSQNCAEVRARAGLACFLPVLRCVHRHARACEASASFAELAATCCPDFTQGRADESASR